MPVVRHDAELSAPLDVSIVIPVFNKLELTKVCLDSLHDVPTEHSLEIIVVDNGSGDGTGDWLAEQESRGRLRALINPENKGFAQACNLGAAAARGRYILFLNNDMEVLPGWLEPMVDCLDRDPRVGIAGACLIFADRTIQHGGVALIDVDLDGTMQMGGTHLCYRRPLDYPAARRNKFMQVVTGACLLIRAEVFTAIGGYDETYWNGNEDVDLCLKAGELGWQVVYMGDSLVYHYESQSGGERWIRTDHNQAHFDRVWRGRARVDYTAKKGHFTGTADNRIRTFTMPTLVSRLASGPAATAQASVIVLTWNALDYTRRCAESLLAHTDSRHELIFVDNGSRPDTLDYLAELEREHTQVKVIRNGRNLGFAAGNNVGLAAASGEYLCLLNSDTVVTPHWLENLIRPLAADRRLGLVGPLTNRITGSQQMPEVQYDQETLVGLDSFAGRVARTNRHSVASALWLVGFCLMIRRDVLLRIGGFDEDYGAGNFEDTDLCLRAFLAGYDLGIAGDSFVHHFGSRTFIGNRLDYEGHLNEKFEIFRRKWKLAADARQTGDFQLGRLVGRGFVPALHFQPLPASTRFEVAPLTGWERGQWLRHGEEAVAETDYDTARRIFTRLLARCPDDTRAANDLACVLWQADPAGEGAGRARELLASILRRDPDNADARCNLEAMDAVAREAGAALQPV